ncbi:hypothetical protein RJP21_04435 [Paenibacillus sp. VCA1]|uniref:hypothetical protein n=1 Tax=Paenibacillus sp. VCA1 TaxID=3039148 RepID=UPI00287198CA|nr:hypothetical protein [Paenibacillus sp. VCA1]MDR9852852.1 hypothetical protein [Paenibacillus sp. VCA1]
MKNLESLLVPGAVINMKITNVKTKEQIILFAVDLDGHSVLVGPVIGRTEHNWFEKCWTLDKKEILKEYFLD